MEVASQFDASAALAAPTSQLDASQLDKNLRQINLVTQGWSLPDLPDDVKLDLASQPGVTHTQLNSFLNGVHVDLNPDQAQPAEQPKPYVTPPLQGPVPSGYDDARRIVAGVANSKPATIVTGDAVKQFKMSAIDKGYLDPPAGGVIDSRWDPELETVRKQMAWDETNSQYRGDRAGAIPFSKAIDMLGKWTSPTGLLHAATQLDLWWDYGAIRKEASAWGDKFRALGKSKNPLEFAKNFVDAMTGPIDDIVVPIANWALLVTGVSEAYDFGKLAMLGKDAIVGSEAIDGIYSTSKIFGGYKNAAEAVNDYNRMGEASGIATRLQGVQGEGALSSVGDAMAKWRDLPATRVSKKLLQTGMRLGVAQQAETSLLPNFHGEALPGTQKIGEAASWLDKNPITNQVAQLFFTPYSTFLPGTILDPAKSALGTVGKTLGTVPGRAAVGALVGGGFGALVGHDLKSTAEGAVGGAVGLAAAPGVGKLVEIAGVATKSKTVGHVSDFLQGLSWKPMSDNERLTSAFHSGMLAHLTQNRTPEELARYTDDFNKNGFLTAWKNQLGVDDEAGSAALGFVMTSAAIDHIAMSQAKSARGSVQALYHTTRDKIISQITTIDMTDPTDATLRSLAAVAARNTSNEFRKYEMILEDFRANPQKALDFGAQHNKMAGNMLRQLTSAEAVPDLNPGAAAEILGWAPEDYGTAHLQTLGAWQGNTAQQRLGILEKYLPQVMPTFGDWGKYVGRTTDLRQITEDGLLDDAVFATWRSSDGRVHQVPRKAAKVATKSQQASDGFVDSLILDPNTDVKKALEGSIDLMSKPDPMGKFTYMLKGNPSENQVRELRSELMDTLQAQKMAQNMPRTWANVKKELTPQGLNDLTKEQFASAFDLYWEAPITPGSKEMQQMSKIASAKTKKNLRRLYDWAKARNISLSDIESATTEHVNNLVDDSRLTDWMKLGKGVRGRPKAGETVAPLLSGPAALKERISQLSSKALYTAAEIDTKHLVEQSLVKFGEGTAEHQRLTDYLDAIDRDGYKLVHGKEFLMPEALLHDTPIFSDINARHMNAVTLGNAFKGKLPAEMREAQNRRGKLAVIDELTKAGSNLKLTVDSPDVNNIVADLHSILADEQGVSSGVRNSAVNGSWLHRRAAAFTTSNTPIGLADLRSHEGAVLKYLEPRYGESDARAIYKALGRFRETEFKDIGLAAVEAKLRANNQIAQGLKMFGGVESPGEVQIAKNFLSRTSTGRKVGAAVGAIYATQTNKDGNDWVAGLEGAALGAGAGTLAQGIVSPAAQKLANVWEGSNFYKYGYMADNLARFRDKMRFTLNPFFDISRYTEGQMLGQIGAPLRDAAGNKVVMPLNMSPSKITRKWAKELGGGIAGREQAQTRWKGLLQEMGAASKGDFAPDAIGSTNEWFQQVGIMGFNPTNWMAAAYHHLKGQGFSPADAYEHARNMYTYGTHGRSAVEHSINTIFFPFSFQKKTYTHIAKYLADDMSRAVLLHDGLKQYETFSKNHDLAKIWKDHLPAIQELERLNLFAFGLSAGKLGGLNRQFIEPVIGAAINLHGKNEAVPGLMNLFSPQGISIKSAADGAHIQKLTKSLLPVMNDITQMRHDMAEEWHVANSPHHQTTSADAREGWDQWNTYKKDLSNKLKANGYSFSDLPRKPWLADQNAEYKAARVKLGAQYPGWEASRTKSLQNFEALNQEKTLRIDKAEAGIGTSSDNKMKKFEDFIKPIKDRLKAEGITDSTDISPEIFQEIQNLGVQFGTDDLEWRRLWRRFYEKDWGPIEAEVGQ